MYRVMSVGSLCLQAPSGVGQTAEPPHPRPWLFQAAPNQWLTEADIERLWYFWNVVLEKTVEGSLDYKEIKLVNPKGNQPWIFTGRADAEAEAPKLWPPDAKSQLIRKDPNAGKDWREDGKGMTEDKMIGWYHRLNGHEFEQAPGDGEGQGNLACCSPRGHKESDTTERLNNNRKTRAFQSNTRWLR